MQLLHGQIQVPEAQAQRISHVLWGLRVSARPVISVDTAADVQPCSVN